MGGRFSRPRAADGMSELPKSLLGNIAAARTRKMNYSQKVVAPIGVLTLCSIFMIYSRTAVSAAKLNAEKHRDAEGRGRVEWDKESLRHHGQLEEVSNDRDTFKEAFVADMGGQGKQIRRDYPRHG